MMTSVWRAFFHAGSLKAGTPLEMASTPVTAAPPEANALSTTKRPAPKSSVPGGRRVADLHAPSTGVVSGARSPATTLTMPHAEQDAIIAMKK